MKLRHHVQSILGLAMKPSILAKTGLLAITGATCAVSANAQEENFFARDRYTSVTERAQPEYDPITKRAGAFEILPEVALGAGYTTNLFASQTNETGDGYVSLVPSLDVRSTWSRHQLGFNASVGTTQYFDNGDESTTDYGVTGFGRVDASSELNFTGAIRADRSHEPRFAAASVPNALEPTPIDRIGGEIGANYEAGRIQIRGTLSVDDYAYDDVELRTGGTLDQSFRDRTETAGTIRTAFAVERDWAIFAEARLIDRSYDGPTLANPLNRDSQGTVFLVGTDFELSSLIRGDIGIGYQNFEFDDPAFSDVSGFSIDGNVEWFVTELTTLSARGVRTVVDPGLQISAGSTLTGFDVRGDHELRRNWLIYGEAGIANYDFEGINREDDRFSLGFGSTWKVNRRAWFEAGYRYTNQDSDFQSFTDNRITLSLRLFP